MTGRVYELLGISEKLLGKREYLQALRLLDEIRPLLDDLNPQSLRPDDYFSLWGWFYQYALTCYRHLGRHDGMALAEEAVERFGTRVGKARLYAQEYKIMRYALRIAYATMARFRMEALQWTEAVAAIDACFELKAGDGEWKNPFEDFYELRTLICHGAAQVQPDAFTARFHTALEDFEKQLIKFPGSIPIEHPDVHTWLADPEYLSFKSRDVVTSLRRGPENETWREALHRYDLVRKTLKLRKREGQTDRIFRQPRESEAALQEAERAVGTAVPTALRDFYTKYGPFAIRDTGYWDALSWGSVRIYGSGSWKSPAYLRGLVDAVNELWGGRTEFGNSFEPSEIASLNAGWVCFGHYLHNDDSHTFLVFDRSGQFARIFYDQDNWGDFQQALKSLLAGASPTGNFDALISTTVNDLVARLIAIKAEQAIDRNC